MFLSGSSCSSQHKLQEGHFQAPLGTDKHKLLLFQVTSCWMWLTEEQAQSQVGNELILPYGAARRKGR